MINSFFCRVFMPRKGYTFSAVFSRGFSYAALPPAQELHDPVVVLRNMREHTVDAALDLPPVLFRHLIAARTIHVIKRTETEETVDLQISLMTGIILTILVCKKLSRVFHVHTPVPL